MARTPFSPHLRARHVCVGAALLAPSTMQVGETSFTLALRTSKIVPFQYCEKLELPRVGILPTSQIMAQTGTRPQHAPNFSDQQWRNNLAIPDRDTRLQTAVRL